MSIIKSFSVGNGDMFCIIHNSDSFTTIDCCYSDEDNRKANFEEIRQMAKKKGITRFISTHPDEDHICGLPEFCEEIGINNFYCVKNEAIKEKETDNFKAYCELRDSNRAFYVSKGVRRIWLNMEDERRGGAGIHFLWPDTSSEDFQEALSAVEEGEGYNNISPIFTYTVTDGVKVMWMGDMEHDFLDKIKSLVSWPKIDVLFAPHHGRKSGHVSKDVLEKLNPYIIVIGEAPSEHIDYYSDYHTITQNTAGHIVFDCQSDKVHIYVGNRNYDALYLDDDGMSNCKWGYYIGSFAPTGG